MIYNKSFVESGILLFTLEKKKIFLWKIFTWISPNLNKNIHITSSSIIQHASTLKITYICKYICEYESQKWFCMSNMNSYIIFLRSHNSKWKNCSNSWVIMFNIVNIHPKIFSYKEIKYTTKSSCIDVASLLISALAAITIQSWDDRYLCITFFLRKISNIYRKKNQIKFV